MKYIRLLLAVFLFQQCVPITPTSSSSNVVISYENKDYVDRVGMVRLFPSNINQQATLEYPVISTGEQGLTLLLDLLDENYEYINARYIHCNANWQPSGLTDLQFLSQYNYSVHTRLFSSIVQNAPVILVPSTSGSILPHQIRRIP